MDNAILEVVNSMIVNVSWYRGIKANSKPGVSLSQSDAWWKERPEGLFCPHTLSLEYTKFNTTTFHQLELGEEPEEEHSPPQEGAQGMEKTMASNKGLLLTRYSLSPSLSRTWWQRLGSWFMRGQQKGHRGTGVGGNQASTQEGGNCFPPGDQETVFYSSSKFAS